MNTCTFIETFAITITILFSLVFFSEVIGVDMSNSTYVTSTPEHFYLYLFQMENVIILHLIQTYLLEDCLSHEDNSWNFQFKGEADRKIADELFWQLARDVRWNRLPYLQAKTKILQEIRKCEFKKDIIILEKVLKTRNLPLVILRNIRDEIMFYKLDSAIIDEFPPMRTLNIDTQGSPRLTRALRKHNDDVINIEWLQSFSGWPKQGYWWEP